MNSERKLRSQDAQLVRLWDSKLVPASREGGLVQITSQVQTLPRSELIQRRDQVTQGPSAEARHGWYQGAHRGRMLLRDALAMVLGLDTGRCGTHLPSSGADQVKGPDSGAVEDSGGAVEVSRIWGVGCRDTEYREGMEWGLGVGSWRLGSGLLSCAVLVLGAAETRALGSVWTPVWWHHRASHRDVAGHVLCLIPHYSH